MLQNAVNFLSVDTDYKLQTYLDTFMRYVVIFYGYAVIKYEKIKNWWTMKIIFHVTIPDIPTTYVLI